MALYMMEALMGLWVIIANNSFAEIYAVEKNGRDIHRIHEVDFPKGRQKSGELLSDRPGRGFEAPKNSGGSSGFSRHAYGTQVDVHSHEQQVFALQLSEILQKGLTDHSFDSLAIIAPPSFLGELRNKLSHGVNKTITKEINKDIPSSLSKQERIATICRLLDIKKPASSAA
jgi:protein required for attachment to host cells